jgi:Flp pilus assembly protein TadD
LIAPLHDDPISGRLTMNVSIRDQLALYEGRRLRISSVVSRRPRRPGAVAALALACALALGGCKSAGLSRNDPLQVAVPMEPGAARAFVEEWGRRYDSNPNDKFTAMTYARGLRATQRHSEATAVLQKLAAQNPKDMDVLAAYGKALADAGRHQEALAVLQGAHTLERPNWSVLSTQGSIADQLGEHEAAQNYYLSALKIAPGEPSVLSNLGLSYALTKKLPQAEQALRQATQGSRADPRIRQNLALVLALQGKFTEAEDALRVDAGPEQAQATIASIRQMIAQSDAWRKLQAPAR